MSVKIFSTLKNYKKEYLPKDILSGIIMAAVSIPISMGYAQIAGVPAVWTLWICSADPAIRHALNFKTVYLRSRCGTGGNCRSCTGNTWSDGRISPGIAVCTIDRIVYRTLVIVVLSFTCR